MLCFFDSNSLRLPARRRARRHLSLRRYEIPNPHQVVRRGRERENPSDLLKAAVPELSQPADFFQPGEYFLNSFSLLLTDFVARMPRSSTVDRRSSASVVFRNVRSHVRLPDVLNKLLSVVSLVSTESHSARAADVCCKLLTRFSLCRTCRPRHAGINCESVPVLHEQVARVAQFCLLAFAFLAQHRLGVGCGLVRLIRTPLTMKVNRGIARIVRRRPAWIILILKALKACRRFDQGPVHREVFFAKQIMFGRARQHLFRERSRDVTPHQPLSVLRECARIPYTVIHIQPHKPPKQQVVVQLLHQLSLASYGIQRLQQQCSQQLFWRNRRPTDLRIKLVQPRRKLNKNLINHFAYWANGMIPRYTLFRRYVAEHLGLMKVVSAHCVFRLRCLIEGLLHCTFQQAPGYLLFHQQS